MKGCRPLTRFEVKKLLAQVKNLRDSALLTLGFCTGYRISELLSLTLADVIDSKGRVYESVTVKAANTKTKTSRTVRLNSDAQKILSRLATARFKTGVSLSEPLFISRKSDDGKTKAISRIQAWRIIQNLCELGDVVTKNVGTHSLRKTFAARIYEAVKGELGKVQIALGHKNIGSTISYLSFNQEEIDHAIMSITNAMSDDKNKKTGRPKSEFQSQAIRVPTVLVPVVKDIVDAFKNAVEKQKESKE